MATLQHARWGGGFGGTLLRITTSEMAGPYPFERRLGAFPDRRRPRGVPPLGAAPRRGDAARRRPRPRAGGRRATGCSRRRWRRRRATTTPTSCEDIEFPDPASRWQPHGLRGRSRLLDTGAFEWTDDGFRAPALRDSVLYELHVGTFTEEGTFDAAIPHLARPARARRHHDRADAARRLPGPPRLGLRRRLHQRRPRSLRRPARPPALRRRRPPRGPRRPARRRLQPRRRVRRAGPGVLRPLLHLALRDAVGPRHELRRRRVRRGARVGAAERRAVDPRLPPRRPAAGRDPRDLRLQPRAPGGGDHAPRARRESARDRDRGVGPQRPEGAHAVGLRRRLGRRLPPRAARAADRRPRGLLRRVRHARRAGEGAAPAALPRRHVLELPAPALRRAGRADRARGVRGLLLQPRPGRQPRARRPPAGRGAPAGRLHDASGTVHADALPGRGTRRARRRSSSSRTTSTRRSPSRRGRAGGASSPPSPSSPARRSRTRRTRRPSAPPSSRARASPPACASSTPRCWPPAASSAPPRPTRSTSTSTRAGCAPAAARTPCSPTSPSATSTCRWRRRRRSC